MSKELVTHSHSGVDRISFRMRRNYNVAKYESVEFDVSLSTDRGQDETVDEAFTRVEKQVYSEWKKVCQVIETKHKGG